MNECEDCNGSNEQVVWFEDVSGHLCTGCYEMRLRFYEDVLDGQKNNYN